MLYAQVIVAKRTNVEELTYAIPAKIIPYIRVGSLVGVPLRRAQVRGVVINLKRTVPAALRSKIREISSIEKNDLNSKSIEVIERLADYYGASVAEVAFHALQGQLLSVVGPDASSSSKTSQLILQAPWQLRQRQYLQIIKQKKGPILLLFAQKAYAEAWKTLAEAEKVLTEHVFIGTIKDAFRPLPQGALIIVDQPYHPGSKSPRRPFMTSRTIAKFRHTYEGIGLVLGTELIHVNDLNQVSQGKIKLKTSLPEPKPFFITKAAPGEIIHPSLLGAMRDSLAKRKKIVVFSASKGWAPVLFCPDCQRVCLCPKCSRPISLETEQTTRCGYCSTTADRPTICPNCRQANLVPLGRGIGQISSALKKLFPNTNIAELSGSAEWPEGVECLVATEKILSFPDFSCDDLFILGVDRFLTGAALNDSWQLLSQLIELQQRSKQIFAQTTFPDHPIWGSVTSQKLRHFFAGELSCRKTYRLPPFGAVLRLVGRSAPKRLQAEIQTITEALEQEGFDVGSTRTGSSADTASLEIFSARPFSRAHKQKIQQLLPPSWHTDVDQL